MYSSEILLWFVFSNNSDRRPKNRSRAPLSFSRLRLRSDNDVVDRDVDELHEEPNESHYAEADGRGDGDLLELTSVRFGATLHQPDGILGEQTAGLAKLDDLIHLFGIESKAIRYVYVLSGNKQDHLHCDYG